MTRCKVIGLAVIGRFVRHRRDLPPAHPSVHVSNLLKDTTCGDDEHHAMRDYNPAAEWWAILCMLTVIALIVCSGIAWFMGVGA